MTLSACLVTSTPNFEERNRTPPFLLSETADPDTRLIHVYNLDETGSVTFGADVVSEDAGDKVLGHLVLDYGFRLEGGDPTPYRNRIGLDASVKPATIDDPPRTLAVTWNVKSLDISPGCHNFALLATHEFNETGCAVDPSDFDYVMWTVLICRKSDGNCCEPSEEGGCPIQCPDFNEDVRCGVSDGASP